ncbi:MAG: N-formylglutamate deformylase [Alphaproteobacteria bacterium]|jgi:N-formylglutamate deformylase|nr:N-formylglutamate deformylase [Alphaproteobacteria bacterium]
MSDARYTYHQGTGPLVVSFPHVGTYLPDEIAATMTDAGRAVADTDWHVHLLYGFLENGDATRLIATHSRYVADLNRDPEGGLLYPGKFETGVCPVASFGGQPLYKPGCAPDAGVVARRIREYWQPYHRQLAAALARAKAVHGYALLLDAHSILSRLPRLFEGRLPQLNLGTADGKSCAPAIADAAMAVFSGQSRFNPVKNGRFKGGYITRHYGRPRDRVHALQLEIAMDAYLDEENPVVFDVARAAPLQNVLQDFVAAIGEAAHR